MIWLLLLSTVIVFLYWIYLKRNISYWKNKNVPQGSFFEVIQEEIAPFLARRSFAETFQDIYYRYPESRYTGYYQFNFPMLMLRDPELIKQITVKDFDHFTDHRSFIPDDVDLLWSSNLFALKGKKWRDMRATLSPSFTSSKMKHLFTVIEETARNFVDYFRKLDEGLIEVELKDIFSRFTNDVIASSAFGIKVDSLKDKDNEFLINGRRATNFTGFLKLIKFIGFLFVPRILKKLNFYFFDEDVRRFFINLMAETVKAREEQNIIRPDLVQLLIEARKAQEEKLEGNKISDIDMAAQGMIFFFAGFDSVANLMSFMGYELAVNPEIQNRLREEIKETLNSGSINYETLTKMKYLDMIVSETLRKWPGNIGIDRICTKDYTIKANDPNEVDVQIKENTVLWLPIFPLHRDPKYFPNPETFDPERFNDENKSNINPYAYIPFGSGPRNCIGSRFALMEIKIIMCHLLNSFQIVPIQKSVIPLKLDKQQFLLAPVDKFWFGLKKL